MGDSFDNAARLTYASNINGYPDKSPDVILISVNLWSLQGFIRGGNRGVYDDILYEPGVFMDSFEKNFTVFVNGLRRRYPDSIIGSHTTPVVKRGHAPRYSSIQMKAINDVYRRVSDRLDLFLFDWDLMLSDFNATSYLRDWFHPKRHFFDEFARVMTNDFLIHITKK